MNLQVIIPKNLQGNGDVVVTVSIILFAILTETDRNISLTAQLYAWMEGSLLQFLIRLPEKEGRQSATLKMECLRLKRVILLQMTEFITSIDDDFNADYGTKCSSADREMIDSSDGACWLDLIICVLE